MPDKPEHYRPGRGLHANMAGGTPGQHAGPYPFAPRLMLLHEARQYLAGQDPRSLGVPCVTARPLRFDRLAIDAALDALAGGGFTRRPEQTPTNDNQGASDADTIDSELAELDRTLAATRRAQGR
tara:strand:+ start:51124 stop:51498 length:375 start_codon:yes stop_codon:yes gene_type:complete